MQKLEFLLNELPGKLKTLEADTKAKWGKMNVQQMIEHFSDSVREANGKVKQEIATEAEKLPLFKNFMMSEKEFRPETKNPLMPAEPIPVRNSSVKEAINELETELKDFVNHFRSNPDSSNTSPIFGDLNFQ